MSLQIVDDEYIRGLKNSGGNRERNQVLGTLWKRFRRRYLIVRGDLPKTGREKLLKPDLIFMDKEGASSLEDRDIRCIVEIEASGGSKSIPGSAVLADYCVKRDRESGKQRGRCYLFFVILRNAEVARKRIESLRERGYFRNVDVRVCTTK